MKAKLQSKWVPLLLLCIFANSGCNAPVDPAATSSVALNDKTPPLVPKDGLLFSEVTADSLRLRWTAAKDAAATDTTSATTSSKLTYLAFYTDQDPGSLLPEAATVKAQWAEVGTAAAGIFSVLIPNLSASTTYFFTVLVSDVAGNLAVYPVSSQATEAATGIADTTAPIIDDNVLVASNITTTGLTLNWTAASDAVTSAASLNYQAYYSAFDLPSIKEWQDTTKATKLGTTVIGSPTPIESRGLTAGTLYYFMVIVSDKAGNASMYKSLPESTLSVDTTAPIPGNNGILVMNNITPTGFTVEWTMATDDVSKVSNLFYDVYYSTTSNDVASLAAITEAGSSNAIYGGSSTGGISLPVSGLSTGILYYVNVVVSDEVGNKTAYTAGTATTSLLPDVTPPTVASGTLTVSNITNTGLTLGWTPASDTGTTEASLLQYLVYYSLSDNLDTISHTQTNGTTVGTYAVPSLTPPSTLNAPSIPITNLTAGTTYYFQVLVRDEAGNNSMYTMKSQEIPAAIFMYAYGSLVNGNLGGREGADALCSTKKSSTFSSLTCTNIHAFLSVSATDYLGNFPTQYSSTFPVSAPIVTASAGHYPIVASWAKWFSGSGAGYGPCPDSTFCNATGINGLKNLLGGTTNTNWTGSTRTGISDSPNGSVANGTCNGWTLGSNIGNNQGGTYGSYNFISSFLSQAWSANNCGSSRELLCVCW
jgi:hypothetical protein